MRRLAMNGPYRDLEAVLTLKQGATDKLNPEDRS
jgi:hypothetical protein